MCVCVYNLIHIYTHIWSHFHYPFIPQWTFGCFHVTPTVNDAEMNVRGQITLPDSNFSSFSDISRTGTIGLYGYTFNFLRKASILFCIVAVPIYVPIYVFKGSFSSTSYLTFVICVLFDDSHSDMCDISLWF